MESVQAAGVGVDLRHESDEDLLIYMSMRAEDPAVAQAAWAEFFRRHAKYLYGRCRRFSRNVLDEAGTNDLVQETLIRAYDKAGTFNAAGIKDTKRLERRTRAWLGRIALNIFRDMLRDRDGRREVPLDENDPAPEPEPRQTSLTSARRQLIDEAIDSLSEKEQIVLRTVYQYYEPGKNLPRAVIEDLANSLKTTSDNLRQIKSRALRKMKQYIKVENRLKNVSMGKKPHDIEKAAANEFEELEQQVYEAFLARGWIIPQTEGDVSAAEATMTDEDDEELPPELRDPDLVLNRSLRRRGRIAILQPDDAGTSELLARAARAGKDIPRDVEDRMKRDRKAAEHLDDE
jgi:RNA polymerase sigma factor (sigma-70 family)